MDQPKSVEDAVQRLEGILKPDDRKRILSYANAELFAGAVHFTIGRDIRNDFGMWTGNHELMQDARKYDEYARLPDDVSDLILQLLYERIKHPTSNDLPR